MPPAARRPLPQAGVPGRSCVNGDVGSVIGWERQAAHPAKWSSSQPVLAKQYVCHGAFPRQGGET